LILSVSDSFVVKLHLDLTVMSFGYMKAVSCYKNKLCTACTGFVFQDEAVMWAIALGLFFFSCSLLPVGLLPLTALG